MKKLKKYQAELMEDLEKAGYSDYSIKSSYFIKIKGIMAKICDKKPTIQGTMYYDDEQKAPEITYENFERYNTTLNPEFVKAEDLDQAKNGLLIATSYRSNDRFYIKWFKNYADLERYFSNYYNTPVDLYFLTQEERQQVVEIMEFAHNDYIKRLKTYWKKYNEKISTYGYWANR